MPGGFVGVDVFFVVSGFLIGSIILDDLRGGRFRFGHFYARRIRRLFPALIVVLLASFALASIYLLESELRQFGRHVAAASLFVSNFALWSESGYFDTAAQAKPLLHLWSLGIEEQFYLAWPAVMWLAWRRPRLLTAAVLAMAIVSFAIELALTPRDPVGAFFSPVTRFWQLLAGVALAANRDAVAARLPVSARLAIAWLGLFLIGIATMAIDQAAAYPGTWALAPTMGTVALVAAGPRTWVHERVLANRGLVWIGLVSYPLYLWHWPLLSFAHILQQDGMPVRMGLVALSFALAWFTWRAIERPIRFGSRRGRARIVALVGAMAAIGIWGFLASNGAVSSFGSGQLRDYEAEIRWTYDRTAQLKPVEFDTRDFAGAAKLKADLLEHAKIMRLGWIPSGNPRKTLYLGDSHMEMYWGRIDQLIVDRPDEARSAVFLTASAFLPVPAAQTDSRANPQMAGLADAAISYALWDKSIDTVVIGARWPGHFGEEGRESPFFVMEDGKPARLMRGRRANQLAYASFGEMLRRLRDGGKRVFVVLDTFEGKVSIERSWKGFRLSGSPREARVFLERQAEDRAGLAAAAREAQAEIIDPLPTLCPDGVNCPVTYDGGHPVYMDGLHLSERFVRNRVGYLDRTLLLTPKR